MKYSIFTTANKSYYPFVDILTSSIVQNCENINRIYVADCGLGEYSNYLSKKEVVSILDANSVSRVSKNKQKITDEYSGVHSDGWVKATQQKTRMLFNLLKSINLDEPLIMIDSDVCVLKDLASVIDTQYHMQVTTMNTGGHTRSDGIFISEIASFLVINDQSYVKGFVGDWISRMEEFSKNGTPVPHETPALNLAIQANTELKIGYLKEIEVCADQELTPETLSVHFKSNGSTNDNPVVNFEKRIMSVNNRTNNDFNIDNYLNEKVYDQWRSEYETN